MITKYHILATALTGIALALGACATATPTTALPPPSFDPPAAWLDRISIVAWLPTMDESEPALGDYEYEPSRFMFQGVPLAANDADDTNESAGQELPAGIYSSQSFSGPGQ